MSQESQFHLLGRKNFLPFFGTQFMGAFNDNIYKNSLMLMVAFAGASALPVNADTMVNLAAGLFILPFFLFSGSAGQLADKYEKSSIIRIIKLVEIVIMAVAAFAIISQNFTAMLALLFLMGTQSAFFGPVKYALLPQALNSSELIGGNALVEMGTFVAILAGTIGAGFLITFPASHQWIAGAVIAFAIVGYLFSRSIPKASAVAPELELDWNPVRQTLLIIQYARQDKTIWQSVLAISWFWALGAAYLTQMPNFAREILAGGPQVVTLMLAVFTIGVALGSLICERLSGHIIEIGIVPIGSLGLSIFGIDLFFAIEPAATPLALAGEFVSRPGNIRVLFDLGMIGFFGGLFIVPLYALMQFRAKPEQRARIIAANNVMNALFMVGSAIAGIILLGMFELSIPAFFLILAIANIAVACYIYVQVPEFIRRFIIWLVSHTLYRIEHRQLDNIPEDGPVVLVCNHISAVDALLIESVLRRPVRFVDGLNVFDITGLNWFFRISQTIPICHPHTNQELYQQAFETVSTELRAGNMVCVFPEEHPAASGKPDDLKTDIEFILEKDPAPVVPLALTKSPGRFRTRVELVAGPALAAESFNTQTLHNRGRTML